MKTKINWGCLGILFMTLVWTVVLIGLIVKLLS